MKNALPNSLSLIQKAESLIPGGTSTLAKSFCRMYAPDTPCFATRARGAYFEELEGRKWLDCDMALGTVVWGHCHHRVNLSIIKQVSLGHNFSVPSYLESLVAEKILNRLGSFSSLRFCKNGADAVSAAVRIARAYTSRPRIVAGSYHGWHDWCAYHHYRGVRRLGIPEPVGNLTSWLEDESLASVRKALSLHDDVAAVVVCPEHWTRDDLQEILLLCKLKGTLLIFDEVKSSIRFSRAGVAGAVGIGPDLLCLSKGLANGLPLAAIVGQREVMSLCDDVRFTSTYATEALSLAAANACEDLLMKQVHWPPWREKAEALMRILSNEIEEHTLQNDLAVYGYHGCFRVGTPQVPAAEDKFRRHFVLTLAKKRIFSAGYILLSVAHNSKHLARIEMAARSAIRTWAERLRGK